VTIKEDMAKLLLATEDDITKLYLKITGVKADFIK